MDVHYSHMVLHLAEVGCTEERRNHEAGTVVTTVEGDMAVDRSLGCSPEAGMVTENVREGIRRSCYVVEPEYNQ